MEASEKVFQHTSASKLKVLLGQHAGNTGLKNKQTSMHQQKGLSEGQTVWVVNMVCCNWNYNQLWWCYVQCCSAHGVYRACGNCRTCSIIRLGIVIRDSMALSWPHYENQVHQTDIFAGANNICNNTNPSQQRTCTEYRHEPNNSNTLQDKIICTNYSKFEHARFLIVITNSTCCLHKHQTSSRFNNILKKRTNVPFQQMLRLWNRFHSKLNLWL